MKEAGTRIPLGLRIWFAAEVFFGVGAVLSIGLFPANTRDNFAWNVQPVVMASVLGAYYMSSALLFVLPLFARRWEMIRVMILPAAIFSSAELLTTILHWSNFSVGTPSFWGWLISYLLPPPIFFGFYFYLERRRIRSGVVVPTIPLPPEVRTPLIHWGAALAVISVALFIFPDLLIVNAPWRMTPLTVRAFVSWLIALAALMLSMARENDRTRVLFGVPMLLLILPTVTIQIARFFDQVNFANVALFILYGFTLVAFVVGVFLARGNWREVLR
jgi:hypothetical protein